MKHIVLFLNNTTCSEGVHSDQLISTVSKLNNTKVYIVDLIFTKQGDDPILDLVFISNWVKFIPITITIAINNN